MTFDPNDNAIAVSEILEAHLKKVRECKEPDMLSPVMKTASQHTIDGFQFKDTRSGTVNSVCMYLCPAFKSKQFSTDCDCKFLSSKIAELGMDEVERLYSKKNFKV